MRPRLTAIVTTLNESVNIRECLESLAFVDEILLVDSFSTDATVEIARSFPGVQVVQREYFGSAAQKNWAMDQVTTPWLLIVDADERIPEALAREIVRTLERGRTGPLFHPARNMLGPRHPPLGLVDRQGRSKLISGTARYRTGASTQTSPGKGRRRRCSRR
jgi:glycosyltransferase involved in cell wall biosynthesis